MRPAPLVRGAPCAHLRQLALPLSYSPCWSRDAPLPARTDLRPETTTRAAQHSTCLKKGEGSGQRPRRPAGRSHASPGAGAPARCAPGTGGAGLPPLCEQRAGQAPHRMQMCSKNMLCVPCSCLRLEVRRLAAWKRCFDGDMRLGGHRGIRHQSPLRARCASPGRCMCSSRNGPHVCRMYGMDPKRARRAALCDQGGGLRGCVRLAALRRRQRSGRAHEPESAAGAGGCATI